MKDFIAGLALLAKYLENGLDETYFCTAEHDIIYVFVGIDDTNEDEDALLEELGFHPDSASGNWAYHT